MDKTVSSLGTKCEGDEMARERNGKGTKRQGDETTRTKRQGDETTRTKRQGDETTGTKRPGRNGKGKKRPVTDHGMLYKLNHGLFLPSN
jgi:hypothetical protein